MIIWHKRYEDEDEQSNIAKDGDIVIAPRLIMDARQVRTPAHTRQQYINRMFGDQRPVAATEAREGYIKRLRRAC